MTTLVAGPSVRRNTTSARGHALRLPVLVALAFVGGAVSALAYPPQRVPGAAILGVALGLWAMRGAGSVGRGALCGLAWGVGFGGLLFRWALALDLFAYLGLVPLQALFWAASGALVAVLGRRLPTGWWVLGATAAWTFVEALRARWPLGGFEWGQLGLSAADLPVRAAAAVVGTLGMTALLAGVAAALAALAGDPRRQWRPLLAAVAATAALTGLGAIGWTAAEGSLEVGIVQVDDPCPGAFAVDCPGFRERLVESHVEGTHALEGEPDLLLWGEGTLRADSPEQAGARVVDALDGLPAPLLSGVSNPGGPGRFHQRNVLYDTDGSVIDIYDKRHPVPFGEYVPMRDVLGGIADVGRYVPSDIVPGERAVAMSVPVADGTVDLGTVVSWEATFSRDVRDAGLLGQAVVTLTTQGSYGPGQPVSDQLLGAAQMRAVELQRAQVVAAATGRSAIILPDGRMVGPTALYAADTLTGEVPLRSGLTPYARFGELPVIVLAAGALVAAAARSRRDRGRGGAG